MKEINTGNWQEFQIGKLFQVSRGRRFVVGKHKEGDIPYYSASLENNGITDYISNPLFIDKNAIIVTTFCDAFYAKGEFTASDEITILHHKKMNEINGLFIVSTIRKNAWKYSFKVKAFQTRIIEDTIKLPINKKGEPDWEYMESYMKNIMQESEQKIENLQNINNYKKKININKWQEYRLGDLFYKCNLNKKNNLKKLFDVSLKKTDEFDLPLVNAKHYNNGIMYYGRSSDFDSEIMTLDIVQNGAVAVGDVYAQPQRTGVLEDAYLVKPYDIIASADVLLFLATVIQKDIKQHFSYDNKCTWDKAKEMTIHLPAKPNGEPDWEYIENYMKNIMQDTQSKLHKFVCC